MNRQIHDNTAAAPSHTFLALNLAEHCAPILGSLVGERPLGVSCCFGTGTGADSTLATTTTTWIRNVATLLSVADMANASVATRDGKTNSTDATQLAIAIAAATNMGCDIDRVCRCRRRLTRQLVDWMESEWERIQGRGRPPWKSRTAIRFRSGIFRNQVLD